MSSYEGKEKALDETPTWAVAVVCFVIVVVSILLETVLHAVGHWFKKLNKPALVEALEKIKSELMLMGFISLLLTVGQAPISNFCVSKSLASTWHPCNNKEEYGSAADSKDNGRRLVQLVDEAYSATTRRSLVSKNDDKCYAKGKVAFVSAYGIHQLHYFIFVLAVFHVLYCVLTYILGQTKMRRWKSWEEETKTIEYQYNNDPERFRFARDTSFGRRHLNVWSKSPILLWIVCFFRQFFGSVTKVDYMTLRHGFVAAHMAPGSGTRFDFRAYIKRSLEEDFQEVVGISPVLWVTAVLFLLTNTHGWYSYLWLPFIPLIILLLVGTKLQVIITRMGLRIQDRGDVVKGAFVVQPADDLFWFGRPRLVLFLIHFVLFQNAFQLAYFLWTLWKFGPDSCLYDRTENIVIRVTMGVVIQVLCSYVTLPLYASVTQMGSSMRPTVFNDRVATAIKNWRHTAKKHTKHSRHSESHTPLSSRPVTPRYGMSPVHGASPVHLLHNYRSSTAPQSLSNSPRNSNYGNEEWDPEALSSVHQQLEFTESPTNDERFDHTRDQDLPVEESSSVHPETSSTQHEINIALSDFTFKKE